MSDTGAVRERLAAQRAGLAAQAEALHADLAGIVAASTGANADDEHDPEGDRPCAAIRPCPRPAPTSMGGTS